MNIDRWGEYKKVFYRNLVVEGIETPEQFVKFHPQDGVPTEKLSSWIRRFTEVPSLIELREQMRLVNRFKLGADPEFVFVQRGQVGVNPAVFVEAYPQGLRVDANTLKLKQGRAFGADNNGRLVELRPAPGRSALEVVTSLLAAMRWMVVECPETKGFEWQAGAFKFKDGLGGHVHFGRKRPSSPMKVKEQGIKGEKIVRVGPEVQALDVLTQMLEDIGVFPRKEMAQRRAGDAYGQHYGLPSDFRMQGHGYEYRTFPSWLDSPWMAMLVITLSKLAVINPQMFLWCQGPALPQVQQARLANIIRYYRGVDDDARLCQAALARVGWPKWVGGDFKHFWGLGVVETPLTKPTVIPPAIPVSKDNVQEMFRHILSGDPFVPTCPQVTWTPSDPPNGYEMLLDRCDTTHQKGLGEMCWDMVGPKELEINLNEDRDNGMQVLAPYWMYVGREVPTYRKDWQDRLRRIVPEVQIKVVSGRRISTSNTLREYRRKDFRKLLLSGVFPIWRVGEVRETSYQEWKDKQTERKEPRMRGKILVEVGG